MPVSKHEEKMVNLQYQLKQNQSELQNYLADLDNWESEIKEKEEKLKEDKDDEKAQQLPPVRNTIQKKKLKKKKKENRVNTDKPKKISGYDFRAWDKFDVDKALQDIDKEEKKGETSSSEYETDEEWELERKKHLANLEKEKGNDCFKKGDYDAAVEAYSRGIEFDATSSILPANRAMALLKQQKFAAAELDCTYSISLDPLYIKAYLRRATARSALGKLQEAVEDYVRVLELEPANKQAKMEKERLEKEMQREKEGPVKSSYTDTQSGIVKPVYKPPEERSKVPLKSITIEEIGIETQTRPQPSLNQSEIAKKVTSEEGKKFDKFFTASPSADSVGSLSQTSSREISSANAQNFVSENNDTGKRKEKDNLNVEGREKGSYPDDIMQTTSSSSRSVAVANEQPDSEKADNVTKRRTENEVKKKECDENQMASTSKVMPVEKRDYAENAFGVPQTSFQFQADFKLLRKDPDTFFQYFQKIPPLQYVKLFGQSLDADILNAVLKSLSLNSDKCKDKLYDMLLNLSLVKRFSMTAMFLSAKDKQVARDLFDKLSLSGKCTKEDVTRLKKNYDL